MLLVVAEAELAPSHGTGAQVLRLLDYLGQPYRYLHWEIRHGMRSVSRDAILLDDDYVMIPRLRGALRRTCRALGLWWWHGCDLNMARFHKLAHRTSIHAASLAYVVIST